MVGTYVCDLTSGLYAAIGTLAALLAREHTGKGQVVDISLLDCACGLTHSAIINYYLLGQVTKRNGNQDRASWPATFYPTKDGRLAFIHAGQDPAFAKFCKMLGREDLLSDPEFAHLTGRANHIQECDTLVASWTKEHTLKEILDACEAIGIPCSRVNNIEEMAHDEQLIYRKMIRPVEDSRFGTITASGPVIKMSDTNPDVYCTAPRLGEHNHLIYHQELGFTEEEIKHMEEEGHYLKEPGRPQNRAARFLLIKFLQYFMAPYISFIVFFIFFKYFLPAKIAFLFRNSRKFLRPFPLCKHCQKHTSCYCCLLCFRRPEYFSRDICFYLQPQTAFSPTANSCDFIKTDI